VTTLSLNGEYYTSLLGTGLTRVGNVLTVDDTVFFSLAAWYATTTDALTEGTTNRYYSTLPLCCRLRSYEYRRAL
jgi:hypothetical protein